MPVWKIVRRSAVALGTTAVLCTTAPAIADGTVGDGRGVFVWFDSAVWSSSQQWFGDGACLQTLSDNNTYLMPASTILANQNGSGFTNLRALASDDQSVVPMPTGARLNNGDVFVISTSLDPTGRDEFEAWSDLTDSDVPSCFGNVDTAKDMTYDAFYSYVQQMIAPASGDPIPISLMFSSFRTLRFGRILSSAQHLDPTDSIYFGGLTEMNADPNTATNLAPEDTDDEGAYGGGCWSIHWPHNATPSGVDDVKMTLNFINRCIDFAEHCNQKGGLGSDPKFDVYLDLELFQLNKVSPQGIGPKQMLTQNWAWGTQYPGIEDMPSECLKNVAWWNNNSSAGPVGPMVDSYWVVPANVADAFWRTLRIARNTIDAYNAQAQPGDVTLTLSVWGQEAYRFCSPRFGVLDTTVSDTAWEQDSNENAFGRFNSHFGTAKIQRRTGGSDDAPIYTPEPWTCDCARLDPQAGPGDASYQVDPPTADDFNINNCIFQFTDRLAYGTYQSLPIGLVQPKGSWKRLPFRNNTSVDMAGQTMTTAPAAQLILPGDGVPMGGLNQDTRINFAALATFAPTPTQVDNDGLLPDGGWLLYPPDFSGNGQVEYNPYYYNSIGAWPPNQNTNAPSWSAFNVGPCKDYWGAYDMPLQGWLPFASRMLTAVDQWSLKNPGGTPPKIIMTLELTPLDAGQAGSDHAGVCFKNSYGNQWTWGDESGTTACAQGNATSGTNQWPNFMVDPLCQSDRVNYLFGGEPSLTNSNSDIPIGNAWGLAPVSRLLAATSGPSGAPLSDHLDPATPYAFNNHLSYHCLMTHQGMDGFYTNPGQANHDPAVNPVTGERTCWNAYRDDFDSCRCPAATAHASGVSTMFINRGVPGDLTGDARTNVDDILMLVDRWGQDCPRPCIFDHDDDGSVGIGDLLEVLEEWGENWN